MLRHSLSGSTVYCHKWSQQQDEHSCKCQCQKIPGTSAEWWWAVEVQVGLAAGRYNPEGPGGSDMQDKVQKRQVVLLALAQLSRMRQSQNELQLGPAGRCNLG